LRLNKSLQRLHSILSYRWGLSVSEYYIRFIVINNTDSTISIEVKRKSENDQRYLKRLTARQTTPVQKFLTESGESDRWTLTWSEGTGKHRKTYRATEERANFKPEDAGRTLIIMLDYIGGNRRAHFRFPVSSDVKMTLDGDNDKKEIA